MEQTDLPEDLLKVDTPSEQSVGPMPVQETVSDKPAFESQPVRETVPDKQVFIDKPKKKKSRLKNFIILLLIAALIATWGWPYIEDSSVTGAVVGLFVDDFGATEGFEDGSPYLGSKNAPVKMIIFSDFQCSYCTKLAEGALVQIKEEYIKTGKVKLIFKHFPLSFHSMAKPAAIASMCAGKQGEFWEYHDQLFKNQGKLGNEYFRSLADELGLDMDLFVDCLSDRWATIQIDLDMQAASEVGVRGTPGTVINGELLTGAQPYAAFKEVIDRKLRE